MNTVVETINAAGRAFVDLALPMLIQSGVLILLLLIVDVILRRKVRAVFRYWIWMLVLVKLVLPPSLGSPVSVGRWFGATLEVPAASWLVAQPPSAENGMASPTEVSPIVSALLTPPDPWMAQPPEPPTIVTPAPPVEAEPPIVAETNAARQPAATSLSWQGLVLLVWLAVASALTLLLVQRAFFVRGLIGQAGQANRALLDELEDCRRRIGLRGAVGLRLSPNATSPAVCGLFRPVILIPQDLAPRLHAHDLEAVLLHELAHVKRGDLWVNLAQTLLQIVYFYNPLLWLANAMIRRTREQAVDETVLVAMGATARQYPETLVNIAKLAFTRRPALSLRLIGVVESKSALTGRIRHMLSRPLPKTARLGVLGLLTVLVLAAVLLPMAKARQNEAAEGLSRFVVLPNCGVWTTDIDGHDLPVLDLASEKIIVLPAVQKERDLLRLTDAKGQGDILYYYDQQRDAAKITFLGSAGLHGEPVSDEYDTVTVTPMQMPFETTVTTRNGGKFEIAIIRTDTEACYIRFRPLRGITGVHRAEEPTGRLFTDAETSAFASLQIDPHEPETRTLSYWREGLDLDSGSKVSEQSSWPPGADLRFVAELRDGRRIEDFVAAEIGYRRIDDDSVRRILTLKPNNFMAAAAELHQRFGELESSKAVMNGFYTKDLPTFFAVLSDGIVAAPGGVGDTVNPLERQATLALICLKKAGAHDLEIEYWRGHPPRDTSGNDADSSASHAVTLPSGVTVELLGISEHPSGGSQWWRPDGSKMKEAPYNKTDGNVYPGTSESAYEIAVQVDGLPKGGAVTMKTEPAGTRTTGTGLDGLRWLATTLPKDLETCTVLCGVAAGEWETAVETTGKTAEATGMALGGVSFSPAIENADSAIVITVTDDITDRPLRVIAATTDGRIVVPSRSLINSAGKARQTTAYFKDLLLSQIGEFRFQTRPWTWVEFQNVSLRPGVKTDVQVSAGSKDAAAMSAGMVGTWLYENPGGDDEQMAVFPDGRVVVLYSNRHQDETRYDHGFITLGEYRNARVRMVLDANGTILHYFGGPDTDVHGKRWRRIAPEPRTDLSAPLAEAGTQRADAVSEPILLFPAMEVVLPENDRRPVILDLATGELVPMPPTGPEPAKMQQALRVMGKGDIVYDVDLGDRYVFLLRDATSEQVQEETGDPDEPGIKGHFIGQSLPETLVVTTREGRRYEVTILAADEKACTLRYSPQPLDRGPGGGTLVEPGKTQAASEAKPFDPNFAVRLSNGVAVELLAYSRLLGPTGLEWWTPQGERTTIPNIYEADAEGHGTLLALRVEPEYVLAHSYQPPDMYRELKIWRMNDSNIRLAAFGEGRGYVNLQIFARVQDPPRTQIISLDRRRADGDIHIDRYGAQKITELTAVGSDAVEFTLVSTAQGLRVVAVVDASARLYPVRLLPPVPLPGVPQRMLPAKGQRYQADVPLKDLSGIVIEGRAARGGEVKFRNLSLMPEQPTRVQVEVSQEDPGPMWFAGGLDAKLSTLADALSIYAQSHAGRYPADLSELRGRMGQEDHEFIEQHMVYRGAGKTVTAPAGTVLAYAKTLLPCGFGTYVLYADRRVEFELPEELKELGILAGKQTDAVDSALELRVVPKRSDLAAEVVEQCMEALKTGRTPADGRYIWAAVPPVADASPDAIVETHDGKTWLLLHNEESFIMYPAQGWKATDLALYTDPSGRPMVRLELDSAGAVRITQLTQAHRRSLAILVDGVVVSAPVITNPALRSVAIAGPFTPGQIDGVLTALKKGMTAPPSVASPPSGVLDSQPRAAEPQGPSPPGISGIVVDPNGSAAAGAQVALITAQAGVSIRDGRLEAPRFGSDEKAQVVETDAQGRFHFESEPNEGFSLVAAHKAGFAIVDANAFKSSHQVRLEPWGRIEGRVAEGREPVENKIWMGGLPNETWLKHRRDYRYETLSDGAGRFTFERVPPGRFEVGYLLRNGEGSSSLTSRTPVVVRAGETAKVTLGGEGRPVIGRFVPPEGYRGSVYFGAGLRALQTRRPDPPRPPDYDRMTKRQQQEWTTNWWRSAEARAYSEAIWSNPRWRAYTFRVNRDGSFRIEDVIPGEYAMTVCLEEAFSGKNVPSEFGGYGGTIEVPEMPGGRSDEPLDLGDLTLTLRRPLHVGDTAPLFEARTLDGKDLRLIDYRGRFVLLSFWQPTSHMELGRLKELHETYGSSGRFQIIGLGGGDTRQEVEKYVAEHRIAWPEVYFGEQWDEGIAARYGLSGSPYILLVDPEGKIIATWLRGDKLTAAVRDAMERSGRVD